MAISKTDLFDAVAEYHRTNERPCPKKHIIASHGVTAENVLKELIADGSVVCRRGRNGGYFPAAVATPTVDTTAAEVSQQTEDDFAAQFAALEAKLAAAEAAENTAPAETDTEAVPF
jgi:DNA-binding IscR family transcriptional regulator